MQMIYQKMIGVALFILGLSLSSLSLAETLNISTLDTPTPVTTNKNKLIVYELMINNPSNQSKRIGRIEISDENNKLLNAYSGTKLIQSSFSYKENQPITDQFLNLEPGMGAVVYVWIALNKDAIAPKQLTNTIWTTEVNSSESKIHVKPLTYTLALKSDPAPIIAAPLKGDNWVAVGSIASDSYHRRAILPIEGNFYLAQRFAIDWERINPNGWESQGNMHKNKQWLAYGNEVLAVVDGTVVNMRDRICKDNTPPGFPNPPPSYDETLGNFVTLNFKQNGKDYYVHYAHLQPNSIKVRLGETVTKGQLIGLLGNTGNSAAPHLHMHVSDSNDPLKTNGLPFVFEKVKLMGTAKDIDDKYGIYLPKYLQKPQEFNNILPPANAIIDFN